MEKIPSKSSIKWKNHSIENPKTVKAGIMAEAPTNGHTYIASEGGGSFDDCGGH